MLFPATTWTFDPGLISGVHPSANVLTFVTVAFSLGFIVSIRLLRFLWVLHRHAAVDRSMAWMATALTVITSCRAFRLAQIWKTATGSVAIVSLPGFIVLVTLLWVPVYYFHGLEQLSRLRPGETRSFRYWKIAAALVAAFFTFVAVQPLLEGRHSLDIRLILAALGTEMLLALAVLLKLRQPGALSRTQILFVALTAGGLAVLCSPPVLLLTSVFTAMPILFFRVLIETGIMLVVLGAFLVFSRLRFADVLLKDVFHIYWWGIVLLATWFGLQVILQLPHGDEVTSVSQHGLFAMGFLLLCMAALPWGERRIDRGISEWLFEQPDYARLGANLWSNLQTSDDSGTWFAAASATLCQNLGFTAAKIVELNPQSPEAKAFVVHKEDAIFPRLDDPIRFLTDPPAELLLPVRLHGELVYALAVSRGPIQGSILRTELEFLRRVVRQLEARLEAGRLANIRREREQHEERLRTQIAEAELRALRAQVQPHFLFNSLNTIAHLTIAAPELAERMTTMLASIFRYVLTSTEDVLVPLEQEVRFIEDYLAIEQMRFGRRLTTEILIEQQARALLVPPLLLQPLVENALLHGLAPKIEGGLLRLTAHSDQQRFCIHVEDTGVGLAASSGTKSSGANVGLTNIRKRLECHYGPSATLTIAERQEGGVSAVVQIPLVGSR